MCMILMLTSPYLVYSFSFVCAIIIFINIFTDCAGWTDITSSLYTHCV